MKTMKNKFFNIFKGGIPMKILPIITVIALALLLIGCTGGEQPKNDTSGTGTDNINTSGNGGTGTNGTGTGGADQTPPEAFVTGAFNLIVNCDVNKLTVKNNGTGSVILNDTTAVQSNEGATTYEKISGNYLIGPGKTKEIILQSDLSKVTDTTKFRLEVKTKNDLGGTDHKYYAFAC